MPDLWKRNFEFKSVPKSKMHNECQHPSIPKPYSHSSIAKEIEAVHSEETKQITYVRVPNIYVIAFADAGSAVRQTVLIATDVIACGMDIKGVNCVINYDFPDSSSTYLHKIGRGVRCSECYYSFRV
ncbi:hypothetical protein ABFS83_04G201800 [Erythranthe nasuta]